MFLCAEEISRQADVPGKEQEQSWNQSFMEIIYLWGFNSVFFRKNKCRTGCLRSLGGSWAWGGISGCAASGPVVARLAAELLLFLYLSALSLHCWERMPLSFFISIPLDMKTLRTLLYFLLCSFSVWTKIKISSISSPSAILSWKISWTLEMLKAVVYKLILSAIYLQ